MKLLIDYDWGEDASNPTLRWHQFGHPQEGWHEGVLAERAEAGNAPPHSTAWCYGEDFDGNPIPPVTIEICFYEFLDLNIATTHMFRKHELYDRILSLLREVVG